MRGKIEDHMIGQSGNISMNNETNAKMEKTRKRINRHFRSYFLNKNCYVIKYPDFDDKLPALFDPDGTYLSFI
jgi:hypothetical protein